MILSMKVIPRLQVFVLYLRPSWQDFDWQSASPGPCAVAELFIFGYLGVWHVSVPIGSVCHCCSRAVGCRDPSKTAAVKL